MIFDEKTLNQIICISSELLFKESFKCIHMCCRQKLFYFLRQFEFEFRYCLEKEFAFLLTVGIQWLSIHWYCAEWRNSKIFVAFYPELTLFWQFDHIIQMQPIIRHIGKGEIAILLFDIMIEWLYYIIKAELLYSCVGLASRKQTLRLWM